VKHAAFVEAVWSQVAFSGVSRAELGLPEDVESSFRLTADDTAERVLAAYRAARVEAERIHAGLALEDIAHHNRRSPMSLRWVLLHLIGELAQHVGHGEILREQLLQPPLAT
jgi:hypothetical protein